MRKLFLAFALLSCTGCTALPGALTTVATGIQANSDTLVLNGTKALTIATDAYTGVATLTAAAVKQGAFSNDQLKMLSTLNDQALALINGADGSLTAAQRAASLSLIVTQLHSILGK